MSTHALHGDTDIFYFTTFTCYKWIPLIQIADAYEAVYRWFDILPTKGIFVCGYVIMPNHVHALLYIHPQAKNLNRVVANGKRFMAYDIVKRLKALKYTRLLSKLEKAVPENEKKKNKKHQVFIPSFDASYVEGDEAINGVLDYIHGNPMEGKWKLVKEQSDYEHSSASQFNQGEAKVFQVFNPFDLEAIDDYFQFRSSESDLRS